MIQPITLQNIVTFQAKKLKQAKRTQTETVVYAEKMILEILKEHQSLVKNIEGNVVVTMSPERYKLIENIRVPALIEDINSPNEGTHPIRGV